MKKFRKVSDAAANRIFEDGMFDLYVISDHGQSLITKAPLDKTSSFGVLVDDIKEQLKKAIPWKSDGWSLTASTPFGHFEIVPTVGGVFLYHNFELIGTYKVMFEAKDAAEKIKKKVIYKQFI